jgi:hypothetical protein
MRSNALTPIPIPITTFSLESGLGEREGLGANARSLGVAELCLVLVLEDQDFIPRLVVATAHSSALV